MKIKKPGYKKLDVFVPSIEGLNPISKTMIFVNNIYKEMILIEYLRIKLLNNLKDKAD